METFFVPEDIFHILYPKLCEKFYVLSFIIHLQYKLEMGICVHCALRRITTHFDASSKMKNSQQKK